MPEGLSRQSVALDGVPDVLDAVALEEIQLLGDLLVAAESSPTTLTTTELDIILGVVEATKAVLG